MQGGDHALHAGLQHVVDGDEISRPDQRHVCRMCYPFVGQIRLQKPAAP
jgi:hypothetical protein